jgi:hypothetical protein
MSVLNMFPMNFVDEIAVSLDEFLDDEVVVIKRPLRSVDPNRCVGIFPVSALPIEGSEMIGQVEPTLQRYNVRIQLLVKHARDEDGRRLYAVDSTAMKTILYRDLGLHTRLATLQMEIMGTVERYKQFQVRSQRFLNNELGSQFVYLSVTDLEFQTELTSL